MSHFSAYQTVLEDSNSSFSNPDDIYIVSEDDVEYAGDLKEHIEAVLPALPRDWEVVRLGTLGLTRDDDRIVGNLYRASRPYWNSTENT